MTAIINNYNKSKYWTAIFLPKDPSDCECYYICSVKLQSYNLNLGDVPLGDPNDILNYDATDLYGDQNVFNFENNEEVKKEIVTLIKKSQLGYSHQKIAIFENEQLLTEVINGLKIAGLEFGPHLIGILDFKSKGEVKEKIDQDFSWGVEYAYYDSYIE